MPMTEDETNALIEKHLPLVKHVLYRVAANFPDHADRDELAQAATLGLVEAAHRYEPERNVPFEHWASVRIRGAILDALRALDFAPRSLRTNAREMEEARATLSANLGRTPSLQEIAQEMQVSTRQVSELQAKVHRALVVSLDAPVGANDDDAQTLADTIQEVDENDPVGILEEREMRRYLSDAIDELPERLKMIVTGYFLEGRSSSSIAEELGVTESRVSQMRHEALMLMRTGIEAQFTEDVERKQGAGRDRVAYRTAAYAAAVASHSSFRGRLSAVLPTVVPAQREGVDVASNDLTAAGSSRYPEVLRVRRVQTGPQCCARGEPRNPPEQVQRLPGR